MCMRYAIHDMQYAFSVSAGPLSRRWGEAVQDDDEEFTRNHARDRGNRAGIIIRTRLSVSPCQSISTQLLAVAVASERGDAVCFVSQHTLSLSCSLLFGCFVAAFCVNGSAAAAATFVLSVMISVESLLRLNHITHQLVQLSLTHPIYCFLLRHRLHSWTRLS